MRALASLLVLTAACATSAAPAGAPQFTSVRDRLAHPTRLYIGPGTSTGEIMASRYTRDGWVSGTTALTVSSGDLEATLDRDGKLAVSDVLVAVDDIAIPDSVFGKPAKLEDVQVTLAQTARADIAWQGDNDASATLTFGLDLHWTIEIDGASSQLGTQHLPPVTVDTQLTGGGDHVDATLALDAQGELWSWADLLKLTELKLALVAGTVDEM